MRLGLLKYKQNIPLQLVVGELVKIPPNHVLTQQMQLVFALLNCHMYCKYQYEDSQNEYYIE